MKIQFNKLTAGLVTSKSKFQTLSFLDPKDLIKGYLQTIVWLYSLKSFSPAMKLLTKRMISIANHSGSSFLCSYLKNSILAMQHHLSGNNLELVPDFPIMLSNGIPCIIPGVLRLEIKKKNNDVIRGVLALLSCYRILQASPKLKLETITQPFTGKATTLFLPDLETVYAKLSKFVSISKLHGNNLLRSFTAGPNYPTSSLGSALDCLALTKSPLIDVLRSLMDETGNLHLKNLFEEEVKWVTDPYAELDAERDLLLGKLSTKIEPAGKVRVFAICDIWSQSALKPIHKFLTSILKQIPQDGTFDQDSPLKSLREVLLNRDNKKTYSFDLSAATDRLPIDLQEDILSLYLGKTIASLWKELLIGREYTLKKSKHFSGSTVKYAVGQPMGALSSWPAMALTHHFIVQVAAHQCLPDEGWFTDYALLGDDIVIANEFVASRYLSLMSGVLGVEVNIFKSLKSDMGVMEFAKRLVSPSEEFTPVGPKNVLLSIKNKSDIASLFLDMKNKGYSLSHNSILCHFQDIPFVKNKKLLVDLFWTIVGPFGFVPTVGGLADSLRLTNSLNTVRFNILISAIDDVLHQRSVAEFVTNIKQFLKALSAWDALGGKTAGFKPTDLGYSPSMNYFRSFCEKNYYKLVVEGAPIRRFIMDAPLGFSIYNPNFLTEISKYIGNKVKSIRSPSEVYNPIEDTMAIIPLPKVNRSRTFFAKVRTNEKERLSVVRASYGIVYPLKAFSTSAPNRLRTSRRVLAPRPFNRNWTVGIMIVLIVLSFLVIMLIVLVLLIVYKDMQLIKIQLDQALILLDHIKYMSPGQPEPWYVSFLTTSVNTMSRTLVEVTFNYVASELGTYFVSLPLPDFGILIDEVRRVFFTSQDVELIEQANQIVQQQINRNARDQFLDSEVARLISKAREADLLT